MTRRFAPAPGLGLPALAFCLALAACTPAPSPPAPAAAPAAVAAPPLAARQTVYIAPQPADARCTVRQGATTYEAVTTGDAVEVDRSTTPLEITCRKPGLRTVRLRRSPGFDFGAPAGQQMAFPDTIPVELGR